LLAINPDGPLSQPGTIHYISPPGRPEPPPFRRFSYDTQISGFGNAEQVENDEVSRRPSPPSFYDNAARAPRATPWAQLLSDDDATPSRQCASFESHRQVLVLVIGLIAIRVLQHSALARSPPLRDPPRGSLISPRLSLDAGLDVETAEARCSPFPERKCLILRLSADTAHIISQLVPTAPINTVQRRPSASR